MILIILSILVSLFIIWRFLFFFRNPKRNIIENGKYILSPADGYVIYAIKVVNDKKQPIFSLKNGAKIYLSELTNIDEKKLQNVSGTLIGIYMTPFSVHYNRAPIAGHIQKISEEIPQSCLKNKSMFNALSNIIFNEKPFWQDCDYLRTNERVAYVINNDNIYIYLTQIADKWIKKIVTYKNNVSIRQGEIFGLIRMGSQVDLFIPDNAGFTIIVKEKDYVKAGISIIGAKNGNSIL